VSSSKNHALCTVLGKRIRALRLKRGWTQQDLAVHLGLSRVHISDVERGAREVGLITLQIIARGLDTTMAKLLRGL
jgi:transcriptional regulator with XRE-family HTH domain